MPYIKQEDRPDLDPHIRALADALGTRPMEDLDGAVNYSISRLFDTIYPHRYRFFNAAIGVLECIKLELYRRVIAPYEDVKIEENGDVYK